MGERKMMMSEKSNLIFQVTLGETVRAWRQEQQMTLTNLARTAGVTKGYLSQVENDKIRHPSDLHLIKIASALNIPVLFLVNRRLPI
ncbi:MAG: helix-turn-helix transcriptional regulator [Candidatus Sungbacteria bacterium]|nr:helix-turn-helix transcriptional regulator [Candidatus Sungbacteria bacterium]